MQVMLFAVVDDEGFGEVVVLLVEVKALHVEEMFCVLCSSILDLNGDSRGRDRVLKVPFIETEPDIVVRLGRLMSPARSVLLAIVKATDAVGVWFKDGWC